MPRGARFLLPPRSRSPISHVERVNPYEQPWIGIKDAISLIMRRRDVGPETAQSNLQEACSSRKVRSRHLLAFTDKHGEKRIGFPLLPPEAWNFRGTINFDEGSLWTLDLGRIENIEIGEPDLEAWLSRPRRGPSGGKIARYADHDRALFATLERIMRTQSKSLTEAARELECEGGLTGRGSSESRIRRLTRLYQRERGRTR